MVTGDGEVLGADLGIGGGQGGVGFDKAHLHMARNRGKAVLFAKCLDLGSALIEKPCKLDALIAHLGYLFKRPLKICGHLAAQAVKLNGNRKHRFSPLNIVP